MYETYLTVIGTVITDPVKRTTSTGDEVMNFRVASNARKLDKDTDEWTDGGTLYTSVNCWRRLVSGIGSSLMKGDPVIVHGVIKTNEYVTKEGAARSDLDLRAIAVGPDLAKCVVKVDRAKAAAVTHDQATPAPAPAEPDPADDPFEQETQQEPELATAM